MSKHRRGGEVELHQRTPIQDLPPGAPSTCDEVWNHKICDECFRARPFLAEGSMTRPAYATDPELRRTRGRYRADVWTVCCYCGARIPPNEGSVVHQHKSQMVHQDVR